jgi:TonB family protein
MFWGELFIRSALLLGALEGVRQLSKALPARYRHAIVLAGFGLLAALPFLSALLPPIHIPALFKTPLRATVTVSTGMATAYRTAGSGTGSTGASWPVLLWMGGAVLVLLRAVTGRLLLNHAIRSARLVQDERWTALVEELAHTLGMRRAPRLMSMSGNVMPLAFGLVRPTILLPDECRQWSEARKRIVLLHELTHIRRRDGLWQLFANLTAAAWWFQPLAWLMCWRLRQESEHACDAQVLAAGVRPSDYATELVEIARSGSTGLLSRAATCMARKGELEPRLLRILAPQNQTRQARRLLVSVSLVAAIAVTAPALSLQQNKFDKGDSLMKRTFISGLLTSTALSAATISGSLFDTTGVAIPDATVVLHSAETSADLNSTSGPDGKFTFGDLAAGQYILRVEKQGFADVLREFTVKQDANIERGLVMQISAAQEEKTANGNATSHMSQPFAPDRIRVKGEVAQSNLIRKVQPVYPAAAKAAHVQGTVLLQVVILKDGTMGEITVADSPSSDLSQSALEAVRQWRYRPTLLNGEPIEVLTYVIVNYTLSK